MKIHKAEMAIDYSLYLLIALWKNKKIANRSALKNLLQNI